MIRWCVLLLLAAAGCKSEGAGIACVADNVCQPACAADPDCATAASDQSRSLRCGRYIVEHYGDGRAGSGTGLVLDTKTGRRWLRFNGPYNLKQMDAKRYCADKQMRLPTKAEALTIADRCVPAWPEPWTTWTSTMTHDGERAWAVVPGFDAADFPVEYVEAALCVR